MIFLLRLKKWWKWIAFAAASLLAILFWRGLAETFRQWTGKKWFEASNAKIRELQAKHDKAKNKRDRMRTRLEKADKKRQKTVDDIIAITKKIDKMTPDEIKAAFEKKGYHPTVNVGAHSNAPVHPMCNTRCVLPGKDNRRNGDGT